MKFLFTREDLEKEENNRLASFAIKNSINCQRQFAEVKDNFRLDFQRDRDRILHCKSFRRLKGKTQVFVSYHGDHFRSRLTHTLEVAQISRSLARSLRVNEDLAETIALAHDLGHTPFGHAGEKAMNDLMQRFSNSFEHNEQSRRIVEKLEKISLDFNGLNLTSQTREGLFKHRSRYDKKIHQLTSQPFLEAQIVDLADEIAYQSHDLDDGLRSGIIKFKELKKIKLLEKAQKYCQKSSHFQLSQLTQLMVQDVLKQTVKNLQKLNPTLSSDIKNFKYKVVSFSEDIREYNDHLRCFLYSNLYQNPIVADQSKQGEEVVKKLFFHFLKNIQDLPLHFLEQIKQQKEKKEIVIKDFIAGMTDNFAFQEAKKI